MCQGWLSVFYLSTCELNLDVDILSLMVGPSTSLPLFELFPLRPIFSIAVSFSDTKLFFWFYLYRVEKWTNQSDPIIFNWQVAGRLRERIWFWVKTFDHRAGTRGTAEDDLIKDPARKDEGQGRAALENYETRTGRVKRPLRNSGPIYGFGIPKV